MSNWVISLNRDDLNRLKSLSQHYEQTVDAMSEAEIADLDRDFSQKLLPLVDLMKPKSQTLKIPRLIHPSKFSHSSIGISVLIAAAMMVFIWPQEPSTKHWVEKGQASLPFPVECQTQVHQDASDWPKVDQHGQLVISKKIASFLMVECLRPSQLYLALPQGTSSPQLRLFPAVLDQQGFLLIDGQKVDLSRFAAEFSQLWVLASDQTLPSTIEQKELDQHWHEVFVFSKP